MQRRSLPDSVDIRGGRQWEGDSIAGKASCVRVSGRLKKKLSSSSCEVSVTIEKRLLKKVDRLAKRLGVSRAKLIAVGLLKVMKAAEH